MTLHRLTGSAQGLLLLARKLILRVLHAWAPYRAGGSQTQLQLPETNNPRRPREQSKIGSREGLLLPGPQGRSHKTVNRPELSSSKLVQHDPNAAITRFS